MINRSNQTDPNDHQFKNKLSIFKTYAQDCISTGLCYVDIPVCEVMPGWNLSIPPCLCCRMEAVGATTLYVHFHHLLSSCTDAGKAAWSARSAYLPTTSVLLPGSACGWRCGSASCAQIGSWLSEQSAGGRCTLEEFPTQPDARIWAAHLPPAWIEKF